MLIRFFASTDNEGSLVEEFEFYPDDTPEDVLENDFKEWRNGMVDMGWEKVKEGKNDA